MGLISTRMKVDLYQINTVYPLNLISYVKQKNNFRYKTCFKLLILESIKTLLISLISLIFHRVFYPWRNLESFVWSRGERVRASFDSEWVGRICVHFVQLSDLCNNHFSHVTTLHLCHSASRDFWINPPTIFPFLDMFLTPIDIFIIRMC